MPGSLFPWLISLLTFILENYKIIPDLNLKNEDGIILIPGYFIIRNIRRADFWHVCVRNDIPPSQYSGNKKLIIIIFFNDFITLKNIITYVIITFF